MLLFKMSQGTPDFDYKGVFYWQCTCKENPDYTAVLTISDTANHYIKLVNVYLNAKRVFGVRLKKENISQYEMECILNRVYWNYICKIID